MTSPDATSAWPGLRVEDWVDTRDTLHLWTQVVGKVRLARSPLVNHWWQVTLYVTPRGLSTGASPTGTGSSTSSSTSPSTRCASARATAPGARSRSRR
nr:DUF5996 family protein [Janibacter melonis]